MPNTHSLEDKLVQPINKIECFILRRRNRQLHLEYNIPTPDMAANQNHHLKDYVAPSQEETHSSIAPPLHRGKEFRVETCFIANRATKPVLW